MTNPVAELEHDHVRFSQSIDRMKTLLRSRGDDDANDDSELLRLVDGLRDDLFAHFAKEEEGLFPFLSRVLPDLRPEIDRLLLGHDIVCGSLVRLAHSLAASKSPILMPGFFDRFERAYQDHARLEVALLRGVGGRLGPDERRELAELIIDL
jgi:hypothetical protein